MTVGITELPPEGMQLPGVALAGDAERGTKTTEGISLLFTSAGVTVQGPQPQIERLLVWSALDSATCREKMQLPDGREAAIMELTSGGQSIRFLLPSGSVSPGQAAYLDQALPTWLVRYKGTAAQVAPAPTAPGAESEVGVALPAAGPRPAAAEAPAEPAAATPAPAYAAAGAAGAVSGATGLVADKPADASVSGGAGTVTGPPLAPPPPMQAQPAPARQAPPPPSSPLPSPSPSPAPAPAPVMQAPHVPPVVQAPAPAPAPAAAAPATAWDDPPLGSGAPVEAPVETKKAKKPKFALTRKQLRAAEAAAAGTAVVGVAVDASPAAPAEVAQAPTFEATKAKKPKFALTRKQLRAAEAAATGTAVAGAVAAATEAPAMAPPADPVPLAVQPPPPRAERPAAMPVGQPIPPSAGMPPEGGTGDGSGVPGADSPLLADTGSKPNHRNLVLVVVLLVVAAAAGGYLITKKNGSTAAAPPPAPTSTAIADTALAGAINLRLADLPSGWTQVPAAQAVMRPPVAPAAAQANAANSLASCLNTSNAVVSGLFASGPLTGQTSLVQSPLFASAAGPSFEMSSRTKTMTSPGQVRALDAVFTSPKFDLCIQGYETALAQAVVPGSTVQIQPVSLPTPAGVSAHGMVSTYTLPGIGTEVVGAAYLLGGRVVTVIHPSTNGPAIPSDVFSPAYLAVTGRVAASATK